MSFGCSVLHLLFSPNSCSYSPLVDHFYCLFANTWEQEERRDGWPMDNCNPKRFLMVYFQVSLLSAHSVDCSSSSSSSSSTQWFSWEPDQPVICGSSVLEKEEEEESDQKDQEKQTGKENVNTGIRNTNNNPLTWPFSSHDQKRTITMRLHLCYCWCCPALEVV